MPFPKCPYPLCDLYLSMFITNVHPHLHTDRAQIQTLRADFWLKCAVLFGSVWCLGPGRCPEGVQSLMDGKHCYSGAIRLHFRSLVWRRRAMF